MGMIVVSGALQIPSVTFSPSSYLDALRVDEPSSSTVTVNSSATAMFAAGANKDSAADASARAVLQRGEPSAHHLLLYVAQRRNRGAQRYHIHAGE